MGQFTISHGYVENVPVIYVQGDMTSESEEEIIKVFDFFTVKGPVTQLFFDFTKTNYINSAGIATLINIINNLQKDGGKVSFIGLTNHFLKVMDIVGISDLVLIFDTLEEALHNNL